MSPYIACVFQCQLLCYIIGIWNLGKKIVFLFTRLLAVNKQRHDDVKESAWECSILYRNRWRYIKKNPFNEVTHTYTHTYTHTTQQAPHNEVANLKHYITSRSR